MGLIMNKQLPFTLNQVIKDLGRVDEEIGIGKGGPISPDTLFFIHTLPQISDALPISKGFYLNGDFEEVKAYILAGNPVQGNIRFFLGYSGWDGDQLEQEIKENTWLVGKGETADLLGEKIKSMWKVSLRKLGAKYVTWSRFPQIPSLN